jgi:protein disulfide-isomerase
MVVLFAGCGRGPDADRQPAAQHVAIAWHQGPVEGAFEAAWAEGKPLLVYWSAEWCPYCKVLETSVFTRPDFVEQSRRAIPVKLDGDDPEGQKWGSQFGVIGFPTLLIFRSDGAETARVSGGMDLEQYATTVAGVLDDPRPIVEVLASAAADPGLLGRDSIPVRDCRRLAYHGWDLSADAVAPPIERSAELDAAADRCPPAARVAKARLGAHALAMRLAQESETIRAGKPASPELQAGIKLLLPLLSRPDEMRGAADVLAGFDDALYVVVKREGPEKTAEFERAWTSAMRAVANDTRFGESERLIALATALDAQKQLRADQSMPADLVAQAREQIDSALAAGTLAGSRHEVVNAARIVFSVLGDDKALYELLLSEIPKSATPYYYMPVLAGIEERAGSAANALEWLQRAYEATPTSGARARWGAGYVRGLTRLAPDDLTEIERAALEVAQAFNERDARVAVWAPECAERLLAPLKKWATTDERLAVLGAVEARLAARPAALAATAGG